MHAPTAGLKVPPEPISIWSDSAIITINIALIPLAILTLVFYYLKRKNIKDKKKTKKYSLVFKIFLFILLLFITLRIVLPILVNYIQNNFFSY